MDRCLEKEGKIGEKEESNNSSSSSRSKNGNRQLSHRPSCRQRKETVKKNDEEEK